MHTLAFRGFRTRTVCVVLPTAGAGQTMGEVDLEGEAKAPAAYVTVDQDVATAWPRPSHEAMSQLFVRPHFDAFTMTVDPLPTDERHQGRGHPYDDVKSREVARERH